MRLQQNQVWQQGDLFIRIVRLERMAVEYKRTKDSASLAGAHEHATKKDFCRLLKGATLLPPTPRIAPVQPPAETPLSS
jgi:hypothetical protein